MVPTTDPGHRRAHPGGDDGLTLVEMIVALGIVMVVLLASLSAFITVQHSQQTAEGTDRATQLATSRIERIRQLEWPKVGFDSTTYTNTLNNAGTAVRDDYNNNYRRINGVVEGSVLHADSTITDILPYQVTDESRNRFYVYTTITWGRKTYGAVPPLAESDTTSAGPEYYTFKRVRVTVRWRSGGNGPWHDVTNEAWLAPKGYQEAPPGVTIRTDTGS